MSQNELAAVFRAVEDFRAARSVMGAEPRKEKLLDIGHELRTPLNAIIGFAQLLKHSDASMLEPAGQRWLTMIEQAGRHMLSVLDEMLPVSGLDEWSAQRMPVRLAGPIEICVAMVAESAGRRGITIRTDIAQNAMVVCGDLVRVRQVLINLLSNAVKYNRDGGCVMVRTRAQDRDIVAIDVCDTGMGMTAEQMEALFQPFNRLGRENGSIEGAGIGLVIAKRLVEQMGGGLRASSAVGRGSTFTMTMPVWA